MDSMLVTGGAGFIGSNFLYYMRKRYPKLRLICVDSLTYAGNIETLKGFEGDGNYRFVRSDIRDRDAMEKGAFQVDSLPLSHWGSQDLMEIE